MCKYVHHTEQVRDYMQTVFVAAEGRYLQEWGPKGFLIHLAQTLFQSLAISINYFVISPNHF